MKDREPEPGETIDAPEIHQRLEARVFMVLSVRRSVQPTADESQRTQRA